MSIENLLLIEEFVQIVKQNNFQQFKTNIVNLPKDVTEITDKLSDKEKERLIKWSKDLGVYLVHQLTGTATKLSSIEFLKINLTYFKQNHLLDQEKRTWLHVAVVCNRSIEILKFIVEDLYLDVEKQDINGNTALHNACQKVKYNEGELNVLIKNSKQLISQSLDDVTPLELSCGDLRKLKDIQKNPLVNLKELLESIDDISSGLPQHEEFYFNENLPMDKMWLNLLHKNDKHRLINSMKKDPNFKSKYYIQPDLFIDIVMACHENGQGIVTYVKKQFFINKQTKSPEEIFKQLSGLNLKESAHLNENVFYTSSVFLSLITGRFELVPTLLSYCQFEIIPFGLIICRICHNLTHVKIFPDQVLENILKLKDFSEKYAIAVLNRTVIRDTTMNKKSISNFLNKSKYLDKTILDIAHLGKCKRFLSLPSCQGAFDEIWWKNNRKCPAVKYMIHSIIHLVFLILFAFVLISEFYFFISPEEIICYIYGLGYLLEELRQIYILKQNRLMMFYLRNPTNIIDMTSLVFMGIGASLRFMFQSDRLLNGLKIQDQFFVTRFVLCISFILYSMRIIYLGSVFKQLGPKLKMISKMIVQDLLPLVFIFLVFIFSFGVTFQSLLYTNVLLGSSKLNSSARKSPIYIISTIFRRATFTIFDVQYTLQEITELDGTNSVTYNGRVATYFFLIIFIVVVNVMLMNLLIALFSYTVTEIIQKSNESWKADRYKDIKEYFDRSTLPPPLNILEITTEIVVNLIKLKRTENRKSSNLNLETFQLLEGQQMFGKKSKFTSFEILQAFSLQDCRYKLIQTEEDKEYERQMNILLINRKLDERFCK